MSSFWVSGRLVAYMRKYPSSCQYLFVGGPEYICIKSGESGMRGEGRVCIGEGMSAMEEVRVCVGEGIYR